MRCILFLSVFDTVGEEAKPLLVYPFDTMYH